eukprot:CAMPEP_0176292358 /NCGR_PEP_ID=MMETSP0121_2-20121125/56040_1 /TAXON_ID=160619 /ORGANISM="Kryptoperidinium foliaceum, Strain CCMP 1326" /LENGTH=127 /DNA_ID=CAMNT_0017633263 /DNA_START=183 /DNA_END=563 /DNA_ORIENTATION=-
MSSRAFPVSGPERGSLGISARLGPESVLQARVSGAEACFTGTEPVWPTRPGTLATGLPANSVPSPPSTPPQALPVPMPSGTQRAAPTGALAGAVRGASARKSRARARDGSQPTARPAPNTGGVEGAA